MHHVAYPCRDAKQTVEWYTRMLNMDFVLAIAEERVPSTHEPDPYMHVFLDAGMGNILAFFELPTKPQMGRDRDSLPAFKAHLEANGVEVLGVTDHSIYFLDPNGHRVELACPDPDEDALIKRLDAVKWDMLDEWSRTKRAPKHADWQHARELGKQDARAVQSSR